MLRPLYDWCINAAGKPHAAWILGAVSFMESSFLPVPPDVMLIPMSLARPDRAWRYAVICTLTSVANGMLTSSVPLLLIRSGQRSFASTGLWQTRWRRSDKPSRYGAWIIVSGRHPIPTRSSPSRPDYAGYNFGWFVLLSLLTAACVSLRSVPAQAVTARAPADHREAAGPLGDDQRPGLVAGVVVALYLIWSASPFTFETSSPAVCQ